MWYVLTQSIEVILLNPYVFSLSCGMIELATKEGFRENLFVDLDIPVNFCERKEERTGEIEGLVYRFHRRLETVMEQVQEGERE